MTLDIETYKDSANIMHIYCISFYDGVDTKSFYIKDFEGDNPDKLLLKALIDSLLDDKYNESKVYIHNLSTFDGIFLLKTIYNLSNDGYKIDLIYKDDKIISITIKKLEYINIVDINSVSGVYR